MHTLFFNHAGKLRSGWRAGFFLALYLMAVTVLMALGTAVGLELVGSAKLAVALRCGIMLVPAVGIGLLLTRVFDGLRTDALGVSPTDGWLSSCALGFGVGVATLSAAVMPAVALGGIAFRYNSLDGPSLLGSLGVFAVAAAFEEALFRGYILQTLAREGYAWPAILITAAFFGLGHAQNPGSTAVSALTTVLAGIWFGVAYLRTRNLWFVWGMHLAWNWTQGSILGVEVSGLTDMSGTPLFAEIDRGPQWLTGGPYGIEGSIATVGAILISATAIHFVPRAKPSKLSSDLNLEADIDRPGRVSQPAD